MRLVHRGQAPTVAATAVVAPTAVLCGDVRIGPGSVVGFGAVLVAEGGSIAVGEHTLVRENAVVRATEAHPVRIGDHVLVGPRAVLFGCTIEDRVFLATGATVFHGARVGRDAEVRVNGVVHLRSVVPPGATVPIGWIAVGDPASILPPEAHERIWEIQEPLDFPGTVYGVERGPQGADMRAVTRRLAADFAPHRDDRPAEE